MHGLRDRVLVRTEAQGPTVVSVATQLVVPVSFNSMARLALTMVNGRFPMSPALRGAPG
jgi:hypothetical protein